MSCKKSKRKDEFQEIKNSSTIGLTPILSTILMLTAGSEKSKARVLEIEADVNPQPAGVPASATFRIRVDGTLVDPEMTLQIFNMPSLMNATRSSALMRANIPVGPGGHTVELLASSPNQVDLLPGGARLTVRAA